MHAVLRYGTEKMHVDDWIEAPSRECYRRNRTTIDKVQELQKTVNMLQTMEHHENDWTAAERQQCEILWERANELTNGLADYRLVGQDRDRALRTVRTRLKKERRNQSRRERYKNADEPERSTEREYKNADQQKTECALVREKDRKNTVTNCVQQQNTNSELRHTIGNVNVITNGRKIVDTGQCEYGM